MESLNRLLVTGALISVILASAVAVYFQFRNSDSEELGATANIEYSDRMLTLAEKEILKTYGDKVSVETKNKALRKFGRNADVGSSYETVWRTGGDETIPTTNVIQYVSSSDNSDTQTMVVEGHTISNNLLPFVVQTVTLSGQSTSTLTTPLRDVTRAYNASTTDFAGTIYIWESGPMAGGVPQTASDIHLTIIEANQSEKTATAVSNDDYFILYGVQCFVFTKTAETAEFTFEFRQIDPTAGPLAWRRIYNTVASNDSAYSEYFDPPFIIPKNSDIRMRAKGDGTSIDVGCSFDGYLASVI